MKGAVSFTNWCYNSQQHDYLKSFLPACQCSVLDFWSGKDETLHKYSVAKKCTPFYAMGSFGNSSGYNV